MNTIFIIILMVLGSLIPIGLAIGLWDKDEQERKQHLQDLLERYTEK